MPEDTENDATTTSTRERWEWLSTIIALTIGVSFPIVVFLHAADPLLGWGLDVSSVPEGWFAFYSFGWLGVLIYVFGPATFREALKIRSELLGGGK